MMRLLCNGVALDLYDNTGLQFTKKNPVFAFDELSAERSVSFKIPSTPDNEKAFSLARVPAYYGEWMRRKIPAELQAGTYVRTGFLYLNKFDGKEYEGILVMGMLYNIKTFGRKEFGQLICNHETWGALVNANAQSPLAGCVKFHTEDAPEFWSLRPSIDMGQLMTMLNAQNILPVEGIDANLIARLILKDGEFTFEHVKEELTGTAITNDEMQYATTNGIIEPGRMQTYNDFDPEEAVIHYKNCFTARSRVVTFPANTPQNLCICKAKWQGQDWNEARIEFVGSRYFYRDNDTQTVMYGGDPLAGQTIELPTEFMLLTADGVRWESWSYFTFEEIQYINQPSFDFIVEGQGTVYNSGATCQVINDLNIGQILKIYSQMSGTMIGTRKDGTILFMTDFGSNVVAPPLIDTKEVARKISTWAQVNIVQFKEADEVNEDERKRIVYTIDNDNLEEQKDLLTLECVEGGVYGDGADDLILARGAKYGRDYPYLSTLPDDIAAEAGAFEYLQRPNLRKCNALQTLCDSSTQIVAQFRMTLQEYADVDSETVFNVRNSLYTWVDGSWQNNVAKFTLARVS